MLGMLISPNIPGAPNTWKVWLDYMIKDKGDGLGIKKGALLYLNGAPAASSSGFSLSSSEVLKIGKAFEKPGSAENLTIQGKTFVVKCQDKNQIVAFNGAKYIIVSRSKSMYVIARCDSKAKNIEAAQVVGKIAKKLTSRDY